MDVPQEEQYMFGSTPECDYAQNSLEVRLKLPETALANVQPLKLPEIAQANIQPLKLPEIAQANIRYASEPLAKVERPPVSYRWFFTFNLATADQCNHRDHRLQVGGVSIST